MGKWVNLMASCLWENQSVSQHHLTSRSMILIALSHLRLMSLGALIAQGYVSCVSLLQTCRFLAACGRVVAIHRRSAIFFLFHTFLHHVRLQSSNICPFQNWSISSFWAFCVIQIKLSLSDLWVNVSYSTILPVGSMSLTALPLTVGQWVSLHHYHTCGSKSKFHSTILPVGQWNSLTALLTYRSMN